MQTFSWSTSTRRSWGATTSIISHTVAGKTTASVAAAAAATTVLMGDK